MKYKKYPEYKDSGVEWIGEIPKDWEIKQTRQIISLIKNGTSANQVMDGETDFKVTRIETISSGKINFEKVGYVEFFKGLESYKLNKGDILFSNINSLAMVGNCSIYNDTEPLYAGMNLLRIVPDKINSYYFLYLLKSTNVNDAVKAVAKHAINQVSVPTNSIKSIKVAMPNSKEQELISNFLDKETARIDGLIDKNIRLVER